MAETQMRDELPPEWMSEEEVRAKDQATADTLVNEGVLTHKKAHYPRPSRPQRVLRGWRPTRDRAAAFDVLVAEQKNISGKNGPTLIDEALDLLFARYKKIY